MILYHMNAKLGVSVLPTHLLACFTDDMNNNFVLGNLFMVNSVYRDDST